MEETSGGVRVGRPRSEQARAAVLHAVDDLLVEVGYSAVTMKGIAERAGVGRQTVYRWWSTKAEILLEASVEDAREELSIRVTGDPRADLLAYATALVHFLTRSPAGAAYRALLGEAQHDSEVAELLAGRDVLLETAGVVLRAGVGATDTERGAKRSAARQRRLDRTVAGAAALLVGPVLFWVATGGPGRDVPVGPAVDAALAVIAEFDSTDPTGTR